MPEVLLGLGANMGDRAANLRAAMAGLRRFLNVTGESPIYETEPMYRTDQAPFLNMVVAADTAMPPASLLAAVKHLERRLGRTGGERFGPRPIDIDILFHGSVVVETPSLVIPHPRMAERGFVLVPAADVAPHWVHPVTGHTVAQMLAALGTTGGVIPFEPVATAVAATG